MEFLERFDCIWKYIPGHTNVADPLSRSKAMLAVLNNSTTHPVPAAVPDVTDFHPNSMMQKIQMAYAEDPWFDAASNLNKVTRCKHGLYHFGKFKPGGRIIIPAVQELKWSILKELHNSRSGEHLGPKRTIDLVARWFWWKGMAVEITDYCQSCKSCQLNKPNSTVSGAPLQPLEIPEYAWQSVSMDLITCLPTSPDGLDCIIVWVDRLTKYVTMQPCKLSIDAAGFAQMIVDHIISKHGMP